MTDASSPAFPRTRQAVVDNRDSGLTKREYAAIHIMAAIIQDTTEGSLVGTHGIKAAAEWAVTGADALLEALAK